MPTDGEILRPLNLLVQAFERQHQNYLKLEESVRELGAYLETADPPEDSRLAEIAEAQQADFTKVRQADERIEALKRRLGELLGAQEVNLSKLRAALAGHRGEPDPASLLKRLEELTALLVDDVKRIQGQTEANEERLRQRLGTLADELRQVQQGKTAARAYRNMAKGVPRPPRFLDKRK